MTTEQIEFAKKISQYILDSQNELDSYDEMKDEGGDPRDHVVFMAGKLLNASWTYDDLKDYLERNKKI